MVLGLFEDYLGWSRTGKKRKSDIYITYSTSKTPTLGNYKRERPRFMCQNIHGSTTNNLKAWKWFKYLTTWGSLINYAYPDVMSLKRLFLKNIWWCGGRGGRAAHYILNIKLKDKNNVYAYGMFKKLKHPIFGTFIIHSLHLKQRMLTLLFTCLITDTARKYWYPLYVLK